MICATLFLLGIGLSIYLYTFWLSEEARIARWRMNYPTKREYYRANPNVRTHLGTECFVCKSRVLLNEGVLKKDDPHRKVSCGICRAKLYRIEANKI